MEASRFPQNRRYLPTLILSEHPTLTLFLFQTGEAISFRILCHGMRFMACIQLQDFVFLSTQNSFSAYALGTEEKAATENKPLSLTGDPFPKIIVRHDIRKRRYDDNGVLNIGVLDFLPDDTLV